VITPFALPGETILARVVRHSRLHSYADLVEVLVPNKEMRDNERVRCRYFGVCAGCQYQVRISACAFDIMDFFSFVDVIVRNAVGVEKGCGDQSL
jgi:hypothetical protein